MNAMFRCEKNVIRSSTTRPTNTSDSKLRFAAANPEALASSRRVCTCADLQTLLYGKRILFLGDSVTAQLPWAFGVWDKTTFGAHIISAHGGTGCLGNYKPSFVISCSVRLGRHPSQDAGPARCCFQTRIQKHHARRPRRCTIISE